MHTTAIKLLRCSFFLLCGVLPSSPCWAAAQASRIAEIIYAGGLQGSWQDWGWAPRSLEKGKPARLHMQQYGGWITARRGLQGSFAALGFELRAPAGLGSFLEVYLLGPEHDNLPHVAVAANAGSPLADGWQRFQIDMRALNPAQVAFDRVVFHATQALPDVEIALDKIVLYASSDAAHSAVSTPPSAAPSVVRRHAAHLSLDCKKPSHSISPLIYGIAYNPQRVGKDAWLWDMRATARRWGGNNTSRYNWQLGNAWNCASDYFFLNVNYTNDAHYSWKNFLDENAAHHVSTALTVPMLGWVAKDTESASYPVQTFGEQQYTAGSNGNGRRTDGAPILGAEPQSTSVAASPAFIQAWIQAIRAYEAISSSKTPQRLVHQYILDNEPALWNSTHRDVHPQALTYDELWQRTQAYASAIRDADPQGLIAGPAEWGWPAYFFSARDAEVGFRLKPDRLAHGDTPLLAWYLKKLHAHAQRTGQHLLDIVDVHFYPQADGVYGHPDNTDAATAALRLRSTRSLWDPSYKDESWINDHVALLPRLKQLIAQNYPGRKISLGEYNFGGEQHISGALAQAEVLGRFGQQDVYSAFYWTYPPPDSATSQAFRAYRNYDGQGGHFLDTAIAAVSDARTSLFASQNSSNDRMVWVVLNLDPYEAADLQVDLNNCGAWRAARAFHYTSNSPALQASTSALQMVHLRPHATWALQHQLQPYSLNVIELQK